MFAPQKRKSLQEQRLREIQREEDLQQQTVKGHLSWLESRAAANRENIIERETKVKVVESVTGSLTYDEIGQTVQS